MPVPAGYTLNQPNQPQAGPPAGYTLNGPAAPPASAAPAAPAYVPAAGNTIGAAPETNPLEDIRNSVANSVVGRSLENFSPKIASALHLTPTETVNSPTNTSDSQQLIAPQYWMPSNPQGHIAGVAKGALTGVGKLTSGNSMATMAALAATGGLAAPLAPVATGLKIAGTGVGGYGVATDLYGAGKKYLSGDSAGGDEQLGEAIPNAAMLWHSTKDEIKKLPDRLIRQPLTRATDQPLPGSSVTPRMRYDSAQRVGAQFDAADATGSPALTMVKKLNRDSLAGAPSYDATSARNVAAVQGATDTALADQSPMATPEERGAFNQKQLQANQAGLKDSATNKFAQLDDATGGQPVPGAGLVGHDAQTILQNEMPFYNKYPSVKPSRAIGVLQDLGKVGDTASYSELQRLRSNTHELTSNNDDLVKEQGTGYLQQMTKSLDNAITDKGLTSPQASLFRDGNGDWADMKENYDDPSNPLYHAVRNPNPSQLDGKIGPQTVENLTNLRPRLLDAGMGALQRGTTEGLLGNTRLGDDNLSRFGTNLYKMSDGYRQSLYGPEMSSRLDDIARTTQGMGQDFNPSGSAKQGQKVAEAASIPSGIASGIALAGTGSPIEGAVTALAAPVYNAAQYGTAKLMNSPKVVDWLMKQPGSTGTGGGVIPPPTGYNENGPQTDKYGYKVPPAEPGPTDTLGKPMLRPERPQPTAPQKPYQPQFRRDSNIRDIPQLPGAAKPVAAAAAPPPQMSLGEQAPAEAPTGPAEVKTNAAAENLAAGPDLSHLNQQVPALDGTATQIHTAGGGKLAAQYRVLEADSIIPSHNAFNFRPNPEYPEGVQERDYFGNRENQLRVIQHAQNYEPDLTISDNADAINGPPVVTPNGVALGGNSRVMSTQRLYGQDGKGGAAYKDYLKNKSWQYGMDPDDIDQMKKPILVREVQSDGSTDSLHKIGALLNKPLTGSLSSTERAVSMGKGLSADTIKTVRGMLDEGEGGSTLRDVMQNPSKSTALLMRMQADGVIGSEERPQYVDSASGGMNEEGKRVFEKSLMGSVMGDANLMESAPKNVTAKLNASIGPLAELASRPDAWNVIPQLRTAIGEHTKMAAANMNVDDYLNQGKMFGQPLHPVAEHLTRVLGQNQNLVRDGFNSFGKDARYAIPGQSTFLGPTPHDAFNFAFKSSLGPEQFSAIKPLASAAGAPAAAPAAAAAAAKAPVSDMVTVYHGKGLGKSQGFKPPAGQGFHATLDRDFAEKHFGDAHSVTVPSSVLEADPEMSAGEDRELSGRESLDLGSAIIPREYYDQLKPAHAPLTGNIKPLAAKK